MHKIVWLHIRYDTHSNWLLLPLLLLLLLFFSFLVFSPTVAVFVIKELLLASISKWANGKAFSYFTESAHRSIHEVFISLIICYIWCICQVYKYVHIHVSVCVCVCVTYALHLYTVWLFIRKLNQSLWHCAKTAYWKQQIRWNRWRKTTTTTTPHFWRALSVNFCSLCLTFNKSQTSVAHTAYVCMRAKQALCAIVGAENRHSLSNLKKAKQHSIRENWSCERFTRFEMCMCSWI